MKRFAALASLLLISLTAFSQNPESKLREDWSEADQEWVNKMETFYTYEDDNVILTINKSYNQQTGMWTNRSKITNEYYPDQNYNYSLVESWLADEWKESVIEIDSLNAAGYTTDATRYLNIDDEGWVLTSHIKYEYQSDTLLIEEWIQNLADLTYNIKIEHYYNEAGKRDSTRSHYRHLGEWLLGDLMYYQYTPSNEIITEYWTKDTNLEIWYIFFETVSIYDSNQFLTEQHQFSYSYENELIDAHQMFYTYNPDGTPHQSVARKSVDDEWVNNFRQTYTYPAATAISEKAPVNLILYPNPAQTEIRFLTDEMGSRGSYRIINATGKTIINGSFSESNNPVNIRELPSGFYLIEIRADEKTAISRFMKN